MSTHGADDAGPGANGHGSDRGARRARLLALLDGGVAGEQRRSSPEGPTEPAAAGTAETPRRGPSGLRARLDRVCVVTASQVGVDGAGVTVMGGEDAGRAGHRDQVASAGPLTRRLEDLQLTVGEGPCLDAYASGMPVLAGDVAAETTRWLGFGPEALAVGAAAVFSLPLQVGAVRLGTLDLHRTTTGPLSGEQLADALTLASLATEMLLELATRTDPDTESLPDPATDEEQGLDAGWLPDVHAEVHIASGMLSARHDIDVVAALLRIRASAFASGEPIRDLARRIIDRDGLVPDDDPDHTETRDPQNGTSDTDTAEGGPPAPGPSPDSSPEDDD